MKNRDECGIPEDPKDINACIYTFLHLEEEDIFQLLHNESTQGINFFQTYGRVRGEKLSTTDGTVKFLIKEVDFKLVNLGRDEDPKYTIVETDLRDSDGDIVCDIVIDRVERQKVGVDFTLKKLFLVENGKMIDFHLMPAAGDENRLTRNGIPCNTRAFVSK
ncbi:hypothetical protein RQM65_10630 [Pricia sp. S334]|uniref:Uncharacterized protein n=1 Tax=Pricia mediterranea TaxID=3076079 RepID=A0ABU3L5V7_9FLAO|nr:hypothetical protein [Pricia sp. S334]MDT7829120.1 hypothetical protein [Pricia sp. S334]